MRNEELKLEELQLGELRNKRFNKRIDMFNEIENLNKTFSVDRRCSIAYTNDRKWFDIITKKDKQTKEIYIDYIVCLGDEEVNINEEGIMCHIQYFKFYR